MAEKREGEEPPETPPLPELPQVPTVKANLPPRRKESPPEAETNQYLKMGIALQLPMTLIAPILVLTLIGVWLDDRFHRSPIFSISGALLGIVVGFINMIRLASRLNR